MPVIFSHADRAPRISARRALKHFITGVFEAEGASVATVRYIFCSDEYLLDINRRFLQHDFFTDIITFDLRDIKSGAVEAEIYISVDRVEENSRELGTSFQDELLRVMFHGPLHLCGYPDKTKSEKKIMREKEEQYLRLYNSSTL